MISSMACNCVEKHPFIFVHAFCMMVTKPCSVSMAIGKWYKFVKFQHSASVHVVVAGEGVLFVHVTDFISKASMFVETGEWPTCRLFRQTTRGHWNMSAFFFCLFIQNIAVLGKCHQSSSHSTSEQMQFDCISCSSFSYPKNHYYYYALVIWTLFHVHT